LYNRLKHSSGWLYTCLATNVLLPVTLPLGITSVSLSVVAFLSTRVKNRILAKITRNERIIVLATAKMNSISELISKVINDNTVTDDEYKLILREYEKYVELKKDVKTTKVNTYVFKDVHTDEFQERFKNDLKNLLATINGRHRAHQVSNCVSESVDSVDNSYSAFIECNSMTWCQEEKVCDNCNYKLLEP